MSSVQVPLTGNPLSPEWMWGECSPDTPEGYEDLQFIYATDFIALTASSPGNLLSNQILALDADSEFWAWRFGFALKPLGGGNTYTLGDLAIRYRDGKGRTLMEDFIVVDEICGPILPCLRYRPGDNILYDIQNRGTGTPTVQLAWIGFKRRKK